MYGTGNFGRSNKLLNDDTLLRHCRHIELYVEWHTINSKIFVLCLLESYHINEKNIPIMGISSLITYILYQNILTTNTDTIVSSITSGRPTNMLMTYFYRIIPWENSTMHFQYILSLIFGKFLDCTIDVLQILWFCRYVYFSTPSFYRT